MAEISTADRNDLPDSAFAYIEPGGSKDSSGKTEPRSLRHFPIHDAAHVRNALERLSQSPFGEKAKAKVHAAAAKMGIDVSDGSGGSDGGDRTLAHALVERRYLDTPVECREVDGERWIGGYAAVFHTPGKPATSRNLGGFRERVMPTAFNQSRQGGFSGAICRFNHDTNMLLGTTAGRTLQLAVDNVGLDYRVRPPHSMTNVLEWVDRGDVQHSSFAFRVPPGGEEWTMDDANYPMRHLVEVQLVDVAPVVDPAYPDATVGNRAQDEAALRSLAAHLGVEYAEVRQMAEADELRRFFTRTDIDGGAPPRKQKPKLLGAAAASALLERRFDPWVDEG
jgi:HK97 family phage prohead protease